MGTSSVFQYRKFAIRQEHAAMKVGTDSDLLGTLAHGGKRILDIGTGTGVLSLMMAQRCPEAMITAIEIDENAVKDARVNFAESVFHDRISLRHISFQDYLAETEVEEGSEPFDSILCNPPYFDKSMECPDEGRTRARHSSSLPFRVLMQGAYRLLRNDGVFSVCIPGEVLEAFKDEGLFAGFRLCDEYQIKTMPHKMPKRFVLVFKKGWVEETHTEVFCMRNADHSRSDWYRKQMREFLTID